MMIEEYKRQIKELQKKIEAIQNGCNHPEAAVKIEYWSNTGNYDPTNDYEGYRCHCTLCDYHFSEHREYGDKTPWKYERYYRSDKTMKAWR